MTTPGDPPPNRTNNARTNGCWKAAEDLWNRAVQNLSEDDQQRLASLRNDKLDILNTVLDQVEIKKQRCLDKLWTYKGRDGRPKVLRDLCDKTIVWVTKFKELGNTFVKFDVSGQTALPWAGVAFLLQVASNQSQTFGRMLEGVERVSFLITRYALVEHAYFSPSGASDALMDHVNGYEKSVLKRDMIMLYSSILKFLAKASGYYGANTAKRIAKGFIETPESAIDDLFDDITSKEDEISHTQHLLAQSSLGLLWEQGSGLRLAVENLRALEGPINRVASQISDIQDTQDPLQRTLLIEHRTNLLKWLSTIPHEKHHASKKSTRLERSGEWLLRDSEFLDWERSSSSSILWVHGMPGCGKSYLLSFFVDQVTKKSPSQRPLTAFFYCSRNKAEPERQEATSIMRSLLKQLCSDSAYKPIRDPLERTFRQRKEAAARCGQEIEPLSLEETTGQIIDVLSLRQDPAFIILDALDECNVDSVHDLLDALEQILQGASGLTKIFVTSRDDGNIRNRLEGTTNVYIDASNNSDDINRFIVAEVDKAISRRRLLGGRVSTSLRDEIVATLKNKAGGMFRWVSLQLQHICNSRKFKIPEAVRDELGKFPATLKESYDVIYDQILGYDDRTRQIAERAISLLLTLRHNLSNNTFITAVCAGHNDKLDETTLVDICCNLITCDNGFRFVHLSAQEFVLQRSEYSAAHVRNIVPARACLVIFFSPKQLSCPRYHRHSMSDNKDAFRCWVKYACRFLGVYLSILDASLATAPGVGIEDAFRSKIRQFLLWPPHVHVSPFQRWREYARKNLIRYSTVYDCPMKYEVSGEESHPLAFIAAYNLRILPVQAGILVPRNGKTEGYLPRQFERVHDGGPQTCLTKFLEKPSLLEWSKVFDEPFLDTEKLAEKPYLSDWYVFLMVHDLYIAEDTVPSYALLCKRETKYFREFTRLGHLRSVPEIFQEFLEMGDDESVAITLLAHPDMMISFEMLSKACRKLHLSPGTRRDLLSRYLLQNHPNRLPNLNMADVLDVIRLIIEKEPELTGNMELFIDIWRVNSDTWNQKTWPLVDLLCSRKVDLDMDEHFFSRMSTDAIGIKIGEITPDRERFLASLLSQPENSVRVDENCFKYLLRHDLKRILQLVSSLRPDIPVNKTVLCVGYRDGYWQSILTHPCPSLSLKDLATIVIENHPPDAIQFFLSCNKDIRIDDGMFSTAIRRRWKDGVDIFRLLADSGRLESDQIPHEVLLDALKENWAFFPGFTALFLARGWVGSEDDIFRVVLKQLLENGRIWKYFCPNYSCLAEHGITVKLSDICDGALLDLRTSQLGSGTEATVDRYLGFCAENMTHSSQSLRQFEKKLAETAHLSHSIFPRRRE